LPLKMILSAILPDPIGFFIPQNNEPNFEELRRYHADPVSWENHRLFVQNSINNKFPKWQSTLRVDSLPTPDELQTIVHSKRPKVLDIKHQITVKFNPKEDINTVSKIELHYFHADAFIKEREEEKKSCS